MATNTNAANLIPNVMRDIGLKVMSSRLAPLSAFSRNFSADPIAPAKTIQVQLVSSGSPTLTNTTNWESGEGERQAKPVVTARYSQPFQCSALEGNQGFAITQLVERNVMTLSEKLIQVAMGPVTVANFTTDPIVSSQAAFGDSELADAYAKVKTYPVKNAILDSRAYANFLSVDKLSLGAVGGRSGMNGFYENTDWTGAGANIYGLVCNPDAILVASALPNDPPEVGQAMIMQDVFTLPDIGLSVQYSMWVSLATKTVWASFDTYFGAGFGLSAAGVLIKSA